MPTCRSPFSSDPRRTLPRRNPSSVRSSQELVKLFAYALSSGLSLQRCPFVQSARTSGEHEAVSDISPRLSHHNPKIRLERRLHAWNSPGTEEMVSGCSSSNSIASPGAPIPKPTAELVQEIAALELEVINLERHLLQLYRKVFDQYLANSTTVLDRHIISPSAFHDSCVCHKSKFQIDEETCEVDPRQHMNGGIHSHNCEQIEKDGTTNCRQTANICAYNLAAASDMTNCSFQREEPVNVTDKNISEHRSLADHLGASLIDYIPKNSCRLSEDIVRCIAATYCKLADPPTQQTEVVVASPSTSASTSSSFSPQDPRDNWSPLRNYQATSSPLRLELPKAKQMPYYARMLEVPRITVDGDRFDYASKMLRTFRSLIRKLETINPRKMKHEEQLAFWINIHNALVMHAFLAHGLDQNQMKSTLAMLKAAYDVGGRSINAYDIQNSILRCQPHRPALWLRARKLVKGYDKHPYALECPEPLAHFALSLGTCSDPAVRVYTAKGVLEELKLARDEFIQASVSVSKDRKIILPKVLYYYAKDAYLQLPDLLEMVCCCLPEAQRKVVRGCLNGRLDKCVEWSSYESAFAYLVHRDLVKQ